MQQDQSKNLSQIVYEEYNSQSDLKRYSELFKNNSQSIKSNDFLEWMHVKNPNETPLICFAKDITNNETAALYTAFAVKFKYFDKVVLAAQSVDTITAIAYRGQGLFIKLAKKLYAESQKKNIKFVYGFPNQNSVSGFINKLKWKEIDEVPFIIKTLRLKFLILKIPLIKHFVKLIPNFTIRKNKKINLSNEYEIKAIKQFDSNFDDFLKTFSSTYQIGINRDSAYLQWRLVNKPNEDYINYTLNYNDTPIAFISYCIKKKHEGNIGYIMEFMFNPEYKTMADKLMQKVINEMNIQKVDVILAWCLNHSINYKSFKNAGFFYLINKLRPIKLSFGSLDFGSDYQEIYNSSNWYLSYLDSDTV